MDILKKEVDFGLDNFQQQKILNEKESIARIILNIFLMKPGNLPSLPHIGIDIREYLYHIDNINVDELKQKIYNQCSELLPQLIGSDIKAFIANYKGQDIMIISVPVYIDEDTLTVLYAFNKTESNTINFDYEFQQTLIEEL